MILSNDKVIQSYGSFGRCRFANYVYSGLWVVQIYFINEVPVVTTESVTADLAIGLRRQRRDTNHALVI